MKTVLAVRAREAAQTVTGRWCGQPIGSATLEWAWAVLALGLESLISRICDLLRLFGDPVGVAERLAMGVRMSARVRRWRGAP